MTDLPKRKASPFVGRNIPESMLNVVVFPAPLWPRRQNRFLSGMPNETRYTAVNGRPITLNVFLRLTTFTTSSDGAPLRMRSCSSFTSESIA